MTSQILIRSGSGAFVLLLSAATAIASGLPIALPQQVVAGTQACLAATNGRTVDERMLQATGWRRVTFTNNGKPVDPSLIFYSNGALLISLSKTSGRPLCSVIARIQTVESVTEVANTMSQALGVTPRARPQDANSVYWFPLAHIVQLKSTGTREAPAIRISVGYTRPGRK